MRSALIAGLSLLLAVPLTAQTTTYCNIWPNSLTCTEFEDQGNRWERALGGIADALEESRERRQAEEQLNLERRRVEALERMADAETARGGGPAVAEDELFATAYQVLVEGLEKEWRQTSEHEVFATRYWQIYDKQGKDEARQYWRTVAVPDAQEYILTRWRELAPTR